MRKTILALLLLASTAWADFDVADNYRPLRYLGSEGDGSTDFDVSWPFEDEADLVVRVSTDDGLTWTTKTLSTHYTVTGEGADEGTVVFNDPLAADDVVMIERNDALERTEDIATLVPSRVNLEFDRQMIQYQQAEELTEKRAIQTLFANDYDDACGAETDFDVVLPLIDDTRKGRAVVVKPNGCGMTLSDGSLGDWGCLKCPGGGGGGECEGGTDDGEDCLTNADCAGGGTCDPGTCDGGPNDGDPCYIDEDCPGGECDPGVCDGGANDGEPCENDADCPDGDCVGGGGFEECDYLSTDAEGVLVCNEGTCPSGCAGDGGGGLCNGGANDGEACDENADCPDGQCEGNWCLECGILGECVGGENDGSPCSDDADCPDGQCVAAPPLICFGGSNDGDPCTQDTDCAEGGRCGPDDNTCLGGDADGESCTSDADCTGLCVGLVCTDDAEEVCANNADCDGFCLNGPGDGVCQGGDNDGGRCQWDPDCPDGECVYCRTCFGGGSADQPCDADFDCPDGICLPCETGEVCIGGPGDGTACTQDTDCPETNDCSPPDLVGVLAPDGVRADAIARFDGSSGRFIEDVNTTISKGGLIDGTSGFVFRSRTLDEGNGFYWVRPTAPGGGAPESSQAYYVMPEKGPYYRVNTDGLDDEAAMVLAIGAAGGEFGSLPYARSLMRWVQFSYPISVFKPGVSTNNELVLRHYFTEDVICPDDWAGSEVWNATTFTASKTYNIQKNGSTVGTAIFDTDAGPNEATLATSAGKTTFAAGDYLDIDAPASADATGAGLSFTLACIRDFQ